VALHVITCFDLRNINRRRKGRYFLQCGWPIFPEFHDGEVPVAPGVSLLDLHKQAEELKTWNFNYINKDLQVFYYLGEFNQCTTFLGLVFMKNCHQSLDFLQDSWCCNCILIPEALMNLSLDDMPGKRLESGFPISILMLVRSENLDRTVSEEICKLRPLQLNWISFLWRWKIYVRRHCRIL